MDLSRAIKEEKDRIRRAVWKNLEETGAARFPRPVYHRIPNFEGSELAASRLTDLPQFKGARSVKVNPDAPQRMVRYYTLLQGKVLLTPTPRLRQGLLLLSSESIPKGSYLEASSIGGAFRFGRAVGVWELPEVDLIVMGSVAVSPDGGRLGKGEGYGEIEYAILRETGRVSDDTQILTSVHDMQVVAEIPQEEHDVPVDIVVTPTRIIETKTRRKRPSGILWSLIDEKRLEEMPILKTLREKAGESV